MTAEPPFPRPGGPAADAARAANAFLVAATAGGVLLVLPLTAFVGALFHLGLCFSSCTPLEQRLPWVFAAVPAAYAYWVHTHARRLRAGLPSTMGPGVRAALHTATAVLVVLAVLVGSCFALLFALEGR